MFKELEKVKESIEVFNDARFYSFGADAKIDSIICFFNNEKVVGCEPFWCS